MNKLIKSILRTIKIFHKVKKKFKQIQQSIRTNELKWINYNRNKKIVKMQGIYLIVFQVFIIIFFGIFVRTSTDITLTSSLADYITIISSGLYFLLAFTATSFRFKMFDWTMMSNMLFILIICLQLNTLYMMFWQSCFNGFSATSSFTAVHFVVGIEAALAVMITAFEFIGQLNIAQIFLIAMVQIFFFALNWVIQYQGVLAMTGGSTMTTFLFGYVFSLGIRKLKFSQVSQTTQEKQKYFTLTLKFLGLVILIFLWPSYNAMTSIPDSIMENIDSKAQLLKQAYLQTFLSLLSAVVTTLAVRIYGQKIMISHFINSIINVQIYQIKTGILVGASAAVIVDPFASILIGVLGPVVYLVYEKYISPLHMKGYPFDKILMCLLAAILNSIFVAGRNGREPNLAFDYTKQAGFQFVNFVLSFCWAILSGFLAGFILTKVNSINENPSNKDSTIWLIEQDLIPLYSDDPAMLQFHEREADKKLKKQQEIFNLKQPFIADKSKDNTQLGKILKKQIDFQSRIK